jgi:FkbM family methyltransferase
MAERRRGLRRATAALYRVPGARPAVRAAVRFAIQRLPLSQRTRQRLYNFFAAGAAGSGPVSCTTRLPSGGSVKVQLDLRDAYVSRMWYFWGYSGYERGTTRLLGDLLPSRSCVLDVGANVGYYSVLAAATARGGEVHAFEPWPPAFRWLARNAELNGFSNLHLNQVALSDVDGEARLFLPADRAWSNASLLGGFVEQRGSLNVPAVRLDTYCRLRGIRRVDLIKLDVEGGELRVLNGLGALLEAWWPDVVCEVLAPFDADLERFFRHTPYRRFLLTDGGPREVAVIRAHPHFRDYYLSRAPAVATGS